jgi:hypothetical protein
MQSGGLKNDAVSSVSRISALTGLSGDNRRLDHVWALFATQRFHRHADFHHGDPLAIEASIPPNSMVKLSGA